MGQVQARITLDHRHRYHEHSHHPCDDYHHLVCPYMDVGPSLNQELDNFKKSLSSCIMQRSAPESDARSSYHNMMIIKLSYDYHHIILSVIIIILSYHYLMKHSPNKNLFVSSLWLGGHLKGYGN